MELGRATQAQRRGGEEEERERATELVAELGRVLVKGRGRDGGNSGRLGTNGKGKRGVGWAGKRAKATTACCARKKKG